MAAQAGARRRRRRAYIASMLQEFSRHRQSRERHRPTDAAGYY